MAVGILGEALSGTRRQEVLATYLQLYIIELVSSRFILDQINSSQFLCSHIYAVTGGKETEDGGREIPTWYLHEDNTLVTTENGIRAAQERPVGSVCSIVSWNLLAGSQSKKRKSTCPTCIDRPVSQRLSLDSAHTTESLLTKTR